MSGVDYKAQIKEKFKNIDLSDGVDKEEAIIIAQNHIIEENLDKVYDLRSANIIAENDPYWPPGKWYVSFDVISRDWLKRGLKWGTLNVDKKSGKVGDSGGGPS